jgi:hypothetical protein
MSVIPLYSRTRIPVIRRDLTEDVLEVPSERLDPVDLLLEQGLGLCESCGEWCEPVQVDPEVVCSTCTRRQIEAALTLGGRLQEPTAAVALRVYRAVIVRPEPSPVTA